MRLRSVFAALLVTMAACAAGPRTERISSPSPNASRALSLHIVHTNDLHGQVHPQKAIWLDAAAPPEIGGFETLGAMVRHHRGHAAARGAAFLYLDAGDIWQGTPEGTLTEGRIVVDWFNEVGLDALAIGNHEFDAGADRLEPSLAQARFPCLCANLVREADGTNVFPGAFDLERQGVKITIIGLVTDETKMVTTKRATEGFDFLPAVETAMKDVASARARGADIVIVLSHCGAETDRRIAHEVAGIDVIIGGHTHQAMMETDAKTGTLIHATWSKGSTLGHVEVTYDITQKKIVAKRAWIEDALTAKWPGHARTATIVERYAKDIGTTMEVVVGRATASIFRARGHTSSPLGNWVTDAMRRVAATDIALANRGGFRADLGAGPIRLRDLFQVSPFSNTLVTLELDGGELRDVFENALARDWTGLEASGLEVRFDPAKAEGSRVVTLTADGSPVDLAKTYTIATNSFVAQGGDGHAIIAGGRNRRDTGHDILQVTVDDLKRRGTLTPDPSRRVAPVEGAMPANPR